MPLFSAIDRNEASSHRQSEPLFAFYDRAAWPEFGACRWILEGWLAEMPPADAAEFADALSRRRKIRGRADRTRDAIAKLLSPPPCWIERHDDLRVHAAIRMNVSCRQPVMPCGERAESCPPCHLG